MAVSGEAGYLRTFGQKMNFSEDAKFPVAVLYADGDLSVFETPHLLSAGRRVDIKAGSQGRFAESTIVDANGLAWEMNGAEEVGELRFFRRIASLFGRSMRLRPNIIGEPTQIELAAFKEAIIKSLRKRSAVSIALRIKEGRLGCTILGKTTSSKLIPDIQAATRVAEAISTILSADFPERELWFGA